MSLWYAVTECRKKGHRKNGHGKKGTSKMSTGKKGASEKLAKNDTLLKKNVIM